MPQSRNNYEVIESFTDEVGQGKEYAKVRYKGIDETGYISRVGGPGDSITKDWYREKKNQQPEDDDIGDEPPPTERVERVIAVMKGEYDETKGFGAADSLDWKLEINGKFKPSSTPSDSEITNIMKEIAQQSQAAMPFIDPNTEVKIDKSTQQSYPGGWKYGFPFSWLEVNFNQGNNYRYDVDPDSRQVEL